MVIGRCWKVLGYVEMYGKILKVIKRNWWLLESVGRYWDM